MDTPYFVLKEIKEGIFAALAKSGTGAFSNSGFVDLGDQFIVFDTFTSPAPAKKLRELGEMILGKPVQFVVNSHYHGDHTFGNQYFSDASIISTQITRDLHKAENVVNDPTQDQRDMYQYLAELQNQLSKETDLNKIRSLQDQYAEILPVAEAVPDLVITLPNVIFENNLTIHGSTRSIELNCYGEGHTPSDTFMYLPDDHVAFMGDLLTIGRQIPVYDPYQFISILDKVLEFEITTYIPGHGGVGQRSDIIVLREYLKHLVDLIEDALGRNISIDQVIKNGVDEKYSNWIAVSGPERNLRVTYEVAKKKHNKTSV